MRRLVAGMVAIGCFGAASGCTDDGDDVVAPTLPTAPAVSSPPASAVPGSTRPPEPTVPDDAGEPGGSEAPAPAEPLPLEQLASFASVAMMDAGSNCTGTLIDTGVAAGPAYVLTNGHCVGDVGRSAQRTTIDVEWFGTAEFFRVAGNLDATHQVDVIAIEYSTMHMTDTAIVRLDATLGELAGYGITAVPITEREPARSDAVTNVGIPVQNLVDTEWVMRRSECTLGDQHTVLEFTWIWQRVWSNDCPGIVQGSSGSPLFALAADGTPEAVVAMINTTTWGTATERGGDCFLNRPCELERGTARVAEQTSYAQSVAGVGECFSATSGEFALGGDCPLSVTSVWASRGGGSFRGGGLPDSVGALPVASVVGRAAGPVRTALVPLSDGGECREPDTYADSVPVDVPATTGTEWEVEGTAVDVDLPETEGWYGLCAVSAEEYSGAATVTYEVDRTPPVADVHVSIEDLGAGAFWVRPYLAPPEIATIRFTWGAAGEVDCSDTRSFQDFFIVPLLLEPENLPATYCVYGMDNAGNASAVRELAVG
jgi:hypothetical protein